MKTCKVLGYTNPIHTNAVPLITIISLNGLIYAQFPDSTRSKLNINSVDRLNNLIPEDRDFCINTYEYSYLTYDGDIITGAPNNILNAMKNDLIKINGNDIHKNMLEDLIVSETIKQGEDEYNILNLLNISDELTNIRFLITTRIKRNRDKAKRIIFQIKKKSGFKTSYKKNLNTNENLSSRDIKTFEKQLYSAVVSLSSYYRKELILNNSLLLVA